VWGLLNGLFIIPAIILSKNKKKQSSTIILNALKIVFTFFLITLTWVFFRSQNISQAFEYLGRLFSKSLFTYPVQHGMALALPLILILFVIEFIRKNKVEFFQPKKLPVFARWSAYLIMIITCLAFFKQNQAFIYFQF